MPQNQGDFTRDPLIRAFGAVLRAHREAAGLSRPQLAESLGCKPGWIEKMETGTKPSILSAIDLDTFFQIKEKTFQTMAEEIEQTGKHTAPPPGFKEYAKREAKASEIRGFSGLLINGLFQSEGYARTILESIEHGADIDTALAERMERKAILAGDAPPRVWHTLDEGALRRIVGSREIMREQLQALLDVSEHPRAMIQVVPLSAGYHAGLGGEFTILGFEGGASTGYTESAGVGVLIEQPAGVAGLQVRYDLLKGHALPVGESRALIRTVMEEI
ncbi:helix-turn-helix domain-containing protein [Actinomadura rugatobispora]|uniref:Scr1 family TA system antitoxin-like transcriptional regulator n=1 Tax=Actinomadura rugatobispora TaxID=1994 RepID=A0ABW0ZRD7_9ACTN|nr:helix-turn-helix transcriptional regulator [Actinomadura rugatobispora]